MDRISKAAAIFTIVALAGFAPAMAATVRVAGDGHARIPFDVQAGHVWVRGVCRGSDSLWIAVDTGASSAAIDLGLARALGFEPHGRHESLGAGGTQEGANVADVTVEIGGVSIHRDSMDALDFAALSAQSSHPLQIIIGYELFEACVVRFDYALGVMDVWEAARAPESRPGISVPMTLEDYHPYVEGALKLPGRAPLRGRFVIDTGSSLGLILAPDVAARESLARAFPRTLELVGRGVGGEVRNRIGRAEWFALGELTFDRPLAVVPDATAGQFSAPGTLGNIGGQILSRCRVTFDYGRRRVGFERGDEFTRPFEADMSGLATTRSPAGLAVRAVNPGTPAAEAGLRVGDVVTRLDGRPVAALDGAALRKLLQREGYALRVEYQRGGEKRSATLRLRRLL